MGTVGVIGLLLKADIPAEGPLFGLAREKLIDEFETVDAVESVSEDDGETLEGVFRDTMAASRAGVSVILGRLASGTSPSPSAMRFRSACLFTSFMLKALDETCFKVKLDPLKIKAHSLRLGCRTPEKVHISPAVFAKESSTEFPVPVRAALVMS
jgi:hypothetical protein